jgi:hypothetical protein
LRFRDWRFQSRITNRKSQMNVGCPGSDRVERGYQPRLIALSIVPNYLKEHFVILDL